MTKKRLVKAVILDMDGLMLDSQGIATRAWKDAVSSYGYHLSYEDNLRFIGRNIEDSNGLLMSMYGPDFPVEKMRKRARQLLLSYIDGDGIPLKPGIMELLDFLKEKNLPFAVATSTARDECLENLEICGLLHRFFTIVCGDEVSSGKPDPEIFLRAAGLLHVSPAFCVVLEDSFAGIRAAHAAGMLPIMVPDLLEPDDEIRSLAYLIVPSLNEAKIEIEKLL